MLSQVSPRQVLEDFVRALEGRQNQADELLTLARRMHHSLEALKANADKVLQHIYRPENSSERGGSGSLRAMFAGFLNEANPSRNGEESSTADPHASEASLHEHVLAELTRWHSAGASEDCPLPHLYRQMTAHVPGVTIGEFQDALRRLHDLGKIYLHPWTGPLYDIPEPSYALLVGHEIAYYASIRK